MAEKKKAPVYVSPLVTAAHTYLLKPDDKAPEGAKFKADGKYKLHGIVDNVSAFDKIDADIRAAAAIEWPGREIDFDEFHFPWTDFDDDAKKEHFRNKCVIKASSKFQPKLVDSKRNALPADMNIFGGDLVKFAYTLYLYAKTEGVKVGKKIEQIEMLGCSLQLVSVQLIDKRGSGQGGDYGSVFDDEDGYETDARESAPASNASSGDNADF